MASVTGIGSTSDLASAIIKNFDKDGSGTLSGTEFASFLGQLVNDLGATNTSGTSTASGVTATTLQNLASSTTTSSERVRAATLFGYDETKMSNNDHTTFKYQIGRILQYYPATPEGLQQALPEIQALVPDAQIVGTHGDKIDFGSFVDGEDHTIGTIDVLVGAASGGKGWAWQPVE